MTLLDLHDYLLTGVRQYMFIGAGEMMSSILRFAALIAAAGLCGCEAKTVVPVAMSQPGDDQLDCPALIQQLKDNRSQADELMRKDHDVAQQNVAKNVVGGLFGPIGLAITAQTDLSNEEQVKARAIIDRNQQLIYLAKRKGCSEQ